MALVYKTLDGFQLKSNDTIWVIGVSAETGEYCPSYYHVNEAMNEGLDGYKERINAKQKCDELNSTPLKKYPIGGYAPGGYYCTCCRCGKQFQGDKRAVECEPCALISKELFDAMSPKEQEELIKRNIETYNQFIKDYRNGKD